MALNYQQYVKSLVTRQYIGKVGNKAAFQNIRGTVSAKKATTINPLSSVFRNPLLPIQKVVGTVAQPFFNLIPSVGTVYRYAPTQPKGVNDLFIDTLLNTVPGSKSPKEGGLLYSPFPEVRQRQDFLSQVTPSKTFGKKTSEQSFSDYAKKIPDTIFTKETTYVYTTNTTNTVEQTPTGGDLKEPFSLFNFVDWKTVLLVGGLVAVYFLSKSKVGSNINLRV